MGAMGAAEGVVDEDIAQRGKLLGHGGVVLGFARVEARVFEHEHFTRLERGRSFFRLRAGGIAGELDGRVDQRRQVVGGHLHAEFRVRPAFGAAQMAHEDYGCAVFEQVVDGGQGGADAGVVADLSIAQRYIEVNPDEGFFALPGDIANRLFVHGGLPSTVKERA